MLTKTVTATIDSSSSIMESCPKCHHLVLKADILDHPTLGRICVSCYNKSSEEKS